MKNNRSRNRTDGFALIVSLFVVSLLLMLILATTSMMRVQIAGSQNDKAKTEAKMNARLALKMALGNLQKYTGPDQRVTARSDIEGSSVDEHWVGVWDSDPNSSDYGKRIAWLASESLEPVNKDKNILLLGEKSVGSDEDLWIYSKPSEITKDNRKIGEYAYWIEDEALKHNVSAIADDYINQGNESSVSVEDFSKTIFKSGVNGLFKKMTGIKDYKNLSKLLAVGQLQAVYPDIANEFKESYHDITIHAKGLFTNVRDGGLQKDLSIGLRGGDFQESGMVLPDDVKNTPELLGSEYNKDFGSNITWLNSVSPTAGGSNPGAPKWSQLRSFYNMHKNIVKGTDPVTGDSVPIFKDVILPGENQMAIAPVMTSFQLYYMGTVLRDAASDPNAAQKAYRVRLHYFPAIVLWNPYSVALPAKDYCLALAGTLGVNYKPSDNTSPRMLDNHWQKRTWNIRKGQDDGDTSTGWWENSSGNWENYGTFAGGNSTHAYEFLLKCPVIPPGRAMIFSPADNMQYDLNDYTQNVLEPGFRSEKSLHVDADDHFLMGNAPIVLKKIELNFGVGNSRTLYLADAADIIDPSEPHLTYLSNSYWAHGGFYIDDRTDWEYRYDVPQITAGSEDYFYKLPTQAYEDADGDGKTDGFDITGLSNVPLGGIDITMRVPENSIYNVASYPHQGYKWITQGNPRSNYSYKSPWDESSSNGSSVRGYGANPMYIARMSSMNASSFPVQEDVSTPNYSFTGVGDTTPVNILFDIPRGDYNSSKGHYDPYPYFSLADLSHAHLTYPQNLWESFDHWHHDVNQPAYAIGNSFPNVRVGKEQIYNNNTGFTTDTDFGNRDMDSMHFDWSYVLNDALWDTYFFSGLEDSTFGLNNPLLEYFKGNLPGETSDLSNMLRTPAYIYKKSAFNVNSTSTKAWRGLFYTMRDESVESLEGGIFSADDKTSFTRLLATDSGAISSNIDETWEDAYRGFRSLSDAEIDKLADEVVKQVKKRGPFLSMSNFVNRSYSSSDSELQLAGALQTAINNAGLNSVLGQQTIESQYTGNVKPAGSADMSIYETDILAGTLVEGIPGYLMQSDILQRVGSVMQARSDTFKIRAYGSSINDITGEENSRVWCEAIVQRIPEYTDGEFKNGVYPSDKEPWVEPTNKSGSIQRRYQIIQFRWISNDQI